MSVELDQSRTDLPKVAAAAPPFRPKVLHVGKFYPPHMGGIETHLQALSEELAKSLDLRVIVANDARLDTHQELGGVRVHRVSTYLTLFSTPICPGMASALRAADADLMHIHLPNPAAVMAYLTSGHRGQLVITYHSDTVKQKVLGGLFEPFLHAALRRASAIIATSPDYVETSPVLQVYRERCHVIPYGIAISQFQNCDSAEVARLRQEHGGRIVICVGRLVYYKGLEHVIRAMAHVEGKLLIIGEGPLRADLQNLAQQLGIAHRVVFVGEIQNDRVAPYYHAADVFALPSVARSEAFGIVQIEAMAAGLPVVNTQLDSGVPFVSQHQKTGLTVPPADPAALAAALNRLLDNPDLRHKFGEAARQRAEREFDSQVMVSRTLRLYDQVLRTSTR